MNAASYLGFTIAFVALVCIVLVVATVTARVGRQRRQKTLTRLAAPHRLLVLEVASGEDDEGQATNTLAELNPASWSSIRPAVVAMLSKVRGAPAERLVEVLQAHGEINEARRRLTSPSPVRRARGAHLLGLARDPSAVAALVRLLDDPAAEVRLVAARSLGLIADAQAAHPVLHSVPGAGFEVGVPAWVAAETLLAMGPAAEGVIQQGLVDPDPLVREVAVTVAGHSMLPTTLEVLRSRLDEETDPVVRSGIATALGHIGSAEDVAALARLTDLHEPAQIRRTCAMALGALGHPAGADTLADLLGDPDRRLAIVCAQALVALGPVGIDHLAAIEEQGIAAAQAAAATALEIARLQGLVRRS